MYRNLVERAFQMMAFALCMLLFPLASSAQTVTKLFPDSAHACVLGAFRAGNISTSIAQVNMYYPDQYDLSTCDSTWTFGGASYLVTPLAGGLFPGNATQAVWLNEAFYDDVRGVPRTRGEMTRQLDRLTEGRVYKVSVDAAWHDDSPGDTYLGMSLGTETPPLLLIQDDSSAQKVSAELCARSTSLLLKLYEAGTNTNGASPVLTNVSLEEKSTPCQFTVTFESNGGSAVAPQTVNYNLEATQPTPPTFGTQAFGGWFTDIARTIPYDFATPVTNDITLYANWVPGYSVGGSVTGMNAGGNLVLLNNGGDALPLGANGAFTFPVQMANASNYLVTVGTQPTGQQCDVTRGSGTIQSANVTNVLVTCQSIYTLGGTLSGLAQGATVVLLDNGGDPLTMNANGSFTFATSMVGGSPYAVTVGTQPQGQTCTVAQGSGTIQSASVTNVQVTCVANVYTVSGTVTGLAPGAAVVLLNNGVDALSVGVDGAFHFTASLSDLAAYAVTVGTQPKDQICTVATGAGNIAAANVINVVVTCRGARDIDGPDDAKPVPFTSQTALLLMVGLLGLLGARGLRRR